jgi:hypothetical protein
MNSAQDKAHTHRFGINGHGKLHKDQYTFTQSRSARLTGKQKMTIKAIINRHEIVFTTNPTGPLIQKYPGTTFERLDRRFGSMAVK